MATAVTVGIAGVSYVAMNPRQTERSAREVADQATCRIVDAAIVAYLAANDAPPTSTAQLADYVKGDITGYRIVNGTAAGPGC